MNNAKRLASKDGIIPEQAEHFMIALKSPIPWVFSNGKWRPKKVNGWKLSESTKTKQSEAKKGNQNTKKDYSLVSSSSGTGTGSSGISGVSSSGSGTV